MRYLRIIFLIVAALGLSACFGSGSGSFSGPGGSVTSVVVHKSERRMFLLQDNTVLRSYEIELGFAPEGHKRVEGDGKTPEGLYFINRKNPNSQYHLALGISYPNAADRQYAASLGQEPGGDIFFHGTPDIVSGKDDWTAGCIAVSDDEIEEIYRLVPVGTPVWIYP